MARADDSIHDLLVQLRNGVNTDEAACKLCACMFVPLCTLGMKKGLSSEDAQELAQETLGYICTPEVINKYNERRHGGKAWVERICERKVIDWLRKLSVRQRRETSINERQEVLLG